MLLRPGYDAVIIGGGVAGLTTALLLAGGGASVAVLERDDFTVPRSPRDAWLNWRRRGIPQFRHLHAYRARLRQLLSRRLPDVLDRLLDAGAAEIVLTERGGDLPPDPDLVAFACRRSTYDYALLRMAIDEPLITCLTGCDVTRILVDDAGGKRATAGAALEDGTVVRSSVVIDASGRASSQAARLEASSLPAPPEHRTAGTMLYFCRYYSFRSEDAWRQQVGPGRRLSTQPLRLGVYLADPPVFAVGMIASAADPSLRLLRRPGHFEAVASMVPSVAAAIRPDTATPISDVFSMGCLPSYLRRYPPGEPAEGFFLAGDALMAVNPAYGRGITLATMHSLVLADALAEARGDLRTAAHVAAEGFAGQVEPWFWDSTVREVQEGLPPFGEVEAIQPAGRYLAALRILHMLDLPAGPIDSSAVADHIVSSHELPANGDGPAHPGPASTGTEEQAMAEVRRALASAGAHHDG